MSQQDASAQAWRSFTFVPAANDWYRIVDETNTGGSIGGLVRVSGNVNGTLTFSELFSLNAQGAAGGQTNITMLECTTNLGVDLVRADTNGTTRTCFDIRIAAAFTGYPVTVDLFVTPQLNPIGNPTQGPNLLTTQTYLTVGQNAILTTGSIYASGSIQAGGGLKAPSGATITDGAGAPSASLPNGSIYLRSDGTSTTCIYRRIAGAWVAGI